MARHDRPAADGIHGCYLSEDWETYTSDRVLVHCRCCDFEVVSGEDPTPAEVWAIEQAHLRDVGQETAPPPVPVHYPPPAPPDRPDSGYSEVNR